MESPKINYMLASWSGPGNDRPNNNFVLRDHLEKLNTLSHNLSQVSIGNPRNPIESKEHKAYISSLKELDDGTPIVVYDMKNNGYSYGQYSRIFEACRDEGFTHYIYMEDDYVPCIDNFDTELVNMFEKIENCGLLCSLVVGEKDTYGMGLKRKPHAAISNGITSHQVLNDVWDTHGILYYMESRYHRGQIEWSNMFIQAGYTLNDYLHKYRSLYYQHNRVARTYWDGAHGEDIIVPIQFWENKESCSAKVYLRTKDGIRASCQFI
jgi:hypothetical protein